MCAYIFVNLNSNVVVYHFVLLIYSFSLCFFFCVCVIFRLIDLESALQDDECTVDDICNICKAKEIPETLRPDVWQICLDVRFKSDQMALFNEIFDLPFQGDLRDDCHIFVDKLGNDEEDKLCVVSDLESILTFYCKNRSLQYESNNGWIELLLPVLSLKLSRSYTYNLFEAIRDSYIPKGCVKNGNVFHLFRLLLLYHDPELCSMLDTKKITPDQYSLTWFQSLFAATCTLPVVLNMWDMYFQEMDPFLVFFLALIMLINGREQILSMKTESSDAIVKFLTFMPCALEAGDVVDFCSLAKYYSNKTPSSFKTGYLKSLFGSDGSLRSDGRPDSSVSQALCLPVTVHELIENISMKFDESNLDGVRFFLVDCRSAEQYNYGHLPTAFHLDSNLMLQEPESFATAVQGLLRSQKMAIEANSNAGGQNLCFMGSGRFDEDQYMHMVVASFLKKNTQYVSVLNGGYALIHDYYGQSVNECLNDHNPQLCMMCSGPSSSTVNQILNSPSNTSNSMQRTGNLALTKQHNSQSSFDLFSKLSNAMKSKSQEVKGKIRDYYGSQAGTSSSNGPPEKHVSKYDRNGKRYRGVAPVFSIDEESVDGVVDMDDTNANYHDIDQPERIMDMRSFINSPDVIKDLKCQEVHMNGYMYDRRLILTKTHLIVLSEIGTNGAEVIVRRPLSNIVKITARKRHRDLITFKYGVPKGDELIITDMDRFLIPNASEATALVSKQIIQQLGDTKNEETSSSM